MAIFAHYWGIDEVGVFVVPALLAIIALRWAERKAKRSAEGKGADKVTEEKNDVE